MNDRIHDDANYNNDDADDGDNDDDASSSLIQFVPSDNQRTTVRIYFYIIVAITLFFSESNQIKFDSFRSDPNIQSLRSDSIFDAQVYYRIIVTRSAGFYWNRTDAAFFLDCYLARPGSSHEDHDLSVS